MEGERESGERSPFLLALLLFLFFSPLVNFFRTLLLFLSFSFSRSPLERRSQCFSYVFFLFLQELLFGVFRFPSPSFRFFFSSLFFNLLFSTFATERRSRHLPRQPVERLSHALLLQR